MKIAGIIRWPFLLWPLALLLLAACSTAESPEGPRDDSPGLAPTTTIVAGAPGPSAVGTTVNFLTEDNVVIAGQIYGTGRTAVVFAHMFRNDQRSWAQFAAEVAGQGYTTLTFDFRGHGETGGRSDSSHIDRDLVAVVRFLRERDHDQVVLVGASMGGTASLKVAARDDLAEVISGVVSVSAPESFRGLIVRDDVSRISVSILFVASEDDQPAAESLESLFERAGESRDRHLFSGSAHGTDLLEGDHAAEFKALLLGFIGTVTSP
jgi:alpha/beta superfamily hydrolase